MQYARLRPLVAAAAGCGQVHAVEGDPVERHIKNRGARHVADDCGRRPLGHPSRTQHVPLHRAECGEITSSAIDARVQRRPTAGSSGRQNFVICIPGLEQSRPQQDRLQGSRRQRPMVPSRRAVGAACPQKGSSSPDRCGRTAREEGRDSTRRANGVRTQGLDRRNGERRENPRTRPASRVEW
jgi:hypothetical protein